MMMSPCLARSFIFCGIFCCVCSSAARALSTQQTLQNASETAGASIGGAPISGYAVGCTLHGRLLCGELFYPYLLYENSA